MSSTAVSSFRHYPTSYPAGIKPVHVPSRIEQCAAGLMRDRLTYLKERLVYEKLFKYELVCVSSSIDERAVRANEYMGAFLRGKHMVSASLATDDDIRTIGKVKERNFIFENENHENETPPQILKIGYVNFDSVEPVKYLDDVSDITDEWRIQVIQDVTARAKKAKDAEGNYFPIEIAECLEKAVFMNNFILFGRPMFARFNELTNAVEIEIIDFSLNAGASLRPVASLVLSLLPQT